MEEIAARSGFSLSVLEKNAWPMRKANLIPRSGRGHAAETIHFDHWHGARLVLVLAAPGPTVAVNVVETLGALEPVHPEAGDFGSLHDALAAEIAIRARCIFYGEPPTGPHDAPGWQLTLCLDPPSAWMTWHEAGQPRRRDYAQPGATQKHHRSVRRLTVIDLDILNALATLCADSLAYSAAHSKTAASAKATAARRSRLAPPPPRLTREDLPEKSVADKVGQPRVLLENTTVIPGETMIDQIPLPNLSRELYERYGQRGPGYCRAYRLAADGVLPTVRERNRLFVERSRLPEVAALLGIAPRNSDIV